MSAEECESCGCDVSDKESVFLCMTCAEKFELTGPARGVRKEVLLENEISRLKVEIVRLNTQLAEGIHIR
jgi:hypothetical protein